MEQILEPTEKFPFNTLTLTSPTVISGGAYFIKYLIQKEPVYIQLPKCKTKQGIVKSGKKFYCDLLFTNDDEEFIQWIESLETYSQKHIFENRSKWFENELDMHDIETSFTPSLKVFKSGKFYLLRVSIPSRLGNCCLQIFDEAENIVDYTTLTDSTNILTILEVKGIRCSVRNFQIEFEVKQMMVLKQTMSFDKCIISRSSTGPIRDVSELLDSRTVASLHSGTDKPFRNVALGVGDMPTPTQLLPENIPLTEVTSSPESVVQANDDNPIHDVSNSSSTESVQELLGKGITDPEVSDDTIPKPLMDDKQNDPLVISPTLEKSYPVETQPTGHITNDIVEVDFPIETIDPTNTMEIKERSDVYYEIYKQARQKAKECRKMAIQAYLEAKQIKELYNLDTIDESDDEDEEALVSENK